MADHRRTLNPRELRPASWVTRLSLTSRILFVNVLPLVLLGGGVIYLDFYRKQLLDERFKLALVDFVQNKPKPTRVASAQTFENKTVIIKHETKAHQ